VLLSRLFRRARSIHYDLFAFNLHGDVFRRVLQAQFTFRALQIVIGKEKRDVTVVSFYL